MTDCEKIKLVKKLLANAFEYYDNENAMAMYVTLDIIDEILNFGGIPAGEADSITR